MIKHLPLLLLLFSLLFSPLKTFAESDFDTTIHSIYTINEQGNTQVLEKIKIVNKAESLYLSSYHLVFGFSNIENVKAYDKDGTIPFTVSASNIKINLPRTEVGIGKINEFNVSFTTSSIAKKIGSIWEVTIPGFSNSDLFTYYQVTINVPESFGNASIIKPKIENLRFKNSYTFTKNEIGKEGIYLLFGEKQIYNFNTVYHIANPDFDPIKTEVAIPPSTNYQDVIIKNIIPPPVDVYEDQDGNWLAIYHLSSKQKLDITVSGVVLVFAKPKEELLSHEKKALYLKESKYWEVESIEIASLAKNLKTPKNIYDYVKDKLTYNYEKINTNNQRYGAKNTLVHPDLSVCLEFTDLFVALSRAAGIPARSVEGYAYTEDSKLKPLSLAKDVLHAWPEYYDFDKKTWIMVDPTWAHTTEGIDYFHSLDFQHVAFVVKGVDSTYPIPAGGYKQSPVPSGTGQSFSTNKNETNSKDVHVSFGEQKDIIREEKVILMDTFQDSYLSGFPIQADLIIKNVGNVGISNKILQVNSDLNPSIYTFPIDSLPPFGSKKFTINFDKTPILTNRGYQVTMLFEGKSTVKNIKVSFIPKSWWFFIGGGTIGAGIIAIFYFALKTRSISIQK